MATHCMGWVAGADLSFLNSLRTQQSAQIRVFVAVASPFSGAGTVCSAQTRLSDNIFAANLPAVIFSYRKSAAAIVGMAHAAHEVMMRAASWASKERHEQACE